MKLGQLSHILDPALNDPELWKIIDTKSSFKEVSAGTLLIKAGEKPKHTWIIAKGLLRHFYHSPDGRERNKNFFREGQIAGSMSAQLTREPCTYNLEVMEDSQLIQFPNFPILERDNLEPSVRRMVDITMQELFLRNEIREAVLLTKSGEERYQWVLENKGWLVERLPQYHLASYLGMDAVSLSRIKARLK